MQVPNYLYQNLPFLSLLIIFFVLTIVTIIKVIFKKSDPYYKYLSYIWIFFLILIIAELVSFNLSTWGWGILSFIALREYFSLVDLRLQDRLGILASYLSIPFMLYFIYTDWYNMFIITIPVYSFLIVPFLLSISGKETEGAVNSVGTIVFGLFLFVFCIGHFTYLSFFSTWMAAGFLLNVIICDTVHFMLDRHIASFKKILMTYFIPLPLTISLTYLLSDWTGIPVIHSIALGFLIPSMVIIGRHTITYLESDLGIVKDKLYPGRGLIIDNIKSILFSAPLVLHYIRYFVF